MRNLWRWLKGERLVFTTVLDDGDLKWWEVGKTVTSQPDDPEQRPWRLSRDEAIRRYRRGWFEVWRVYGFPAERHAGRI